MRKLTVKVVIGLMVLMFLLTSIAPLARAASTTYTVQPGDSLWQIASKYKTTVNNLKKLNNHWSDKVRVGQKLLVPAAAPTSWVYTVKSGDSLWKIAKKVGVSANSIKQASGLKSNTIKVGQKLRIPANGAASTATAGVSSADLTLLARVIHAEARGESYTGQVAVGAVLVNRVQSSKFPNTMQGVVYQKNAFETVSNGQIWLQPSATAYKAARAALNGSDPTGGALYFYNPAKIKNPKSWIWTRRVTLKIGRHNFAV